jgi:hypothetical protein
MSQPTRKYSSPAISALLVAALLPGCAGISPEMGSEMLKDLPGTIVDAQTLLRGGSSPADLHEKFAAAGRLLQTVEKYNRLSQQQRYQVERIAQRRYDNLVESKKTKLAGTYKAKKKAIAAKPIPEEKKEKELAKVDKEWYSAAKSEAKKEYGSGFAVPVKNSEGKSVVAFARIDGDKAVAASDSYVLASAPKTGGQVSHSGGSYTVVSDSIR